MADKKGKEGALLSKGLRGSGLLFIALPGMQEVLSFTRVLQKRKESPLFLEQNDCS